MGTSTLLGLDPARIAQVPGLLEDAREREGEVPPLRDGHADGADRRRPLANAGQ
jgi:hypothetical protein